MRDASAHSLLAPLPVRAARLGACASVAAHSAPPAAPARRMRLLLAAAAAAAAAAAVGASAGTAAPPWQLRRGTLVVHEIPTGNAFGTRSYLLGDTATHEAALVDCGGNASGALAVAAAHGLRVTSLLLTHAHVDHVSGLAAAAAGAAPGAALHLHAGDAALYAAYGLPLPGAVGAAAAAALPVAGRIAAAAGATRLRLPPVAVWLSDGDVLSVGAARLRVSHTPGHSAGHVVFYEPALRLLLGGDLLLGASVGRTDLPGGDEGAQRASAAAACARLPDDALVLSGHAPPLSAATLRRINPWCRDATAGQQGRGAGRGQPRGEQEL